MKWFLNLSTRAKLLVAIGVMIFFIAIVMATAYQGFRAVGESQEALYDIQFQDLKDVQTVRSSENGVRATLLEMLIVKGKTKREQKSQDVEQFSKKVDAILPGLLQRNRYDPRMFQDLQKLESVRTAFKRIRDAEVIPLLLEGKDQEAMQILSGIQMERYHQMDEISARLKDVALAEAREGMRETSRTIRRSLIEFSLAGILAIIIGLALAALLSRVIAAPLGDISKLAERVASGDLTVSISSDHRGDEVGVLTQTFRKMVQNLREVNRQILESVNVLAAAASEILASTTQLASGAGETAAAINETTTTLEEVKQTAQLSNQKAKYVMDSAQKSNQASQAGKRAVEQALQGMQQIKDQMESVAASIVQLSEQSQAIGEIIATVNDLAEQSNLLAVNAAIEAAKAGEQGKGFAVVAQEVKSLAEQSKQATAQVRRILADIQKATTASVMATEQGSKSVDAGVKQSQETDESIRLLVENIAEASQAAAQIAASAQQQMVGTDQVSSAMESIRLASTQNVASTKQAEVSAQNLHDLGQKLKELVGRYRV